MVQVLRLILQKYPRCTEHHYQCRETIKLTQHDANRSDPYHAIQPVNTFTQQWHPLISVVAEGSRAKRIFIGFGSGKSRLSAIAQLYGAVPGREGPLFEFQTTAKSGWKPGVLTTLPIGMAVQGLSLVLIVVQGGMVGMGELGASISSDAKRAAKKLADELETVLKNLSRP